MATSKYVLYTLFLTFTSTTTLAGQFNSIIDIGDKMPFFENLPSTSGKLISSDNINENIVVFISLANHCPWVKGMDKDLVELTEHFAEHDIKFIGLSMSHREDDKLPAMVEHAEKVGYTFDYLYDQSQEIGRSLGATRAPEYFIFNENRKLIYTGALYNSPAKMNKDGTVRYINGTPTEHYVHAALQATLDGNEVLTKETRAHGCAVKYVN